MRRPALLLGALLACAAAAPIYAQNEKIPDLTGLWQRNAVRGEVTYLEVPDDKDGKPIARKWIEGPDIEEIVAAEYDNPILQPWVREIVKKNTDREIKLDHVDEADDICRPVGIPQIINL